MAELFRLRIASGRVVVPPRLLNRLNLQDGDELRVQINDDSTLTLDTAAGAKNIRPSRKHLAELRRREKELVPRHEVDKFLSTIKHKVSKGAASA